MHEWLDIRLADVELPDGCHLSHRSIVTPPGAGVAVIDVDQRVLLMWRHRYITGTWGWEIFDVRGVVRPRKPRPS